MKDNPWIGVDLDGTLAQQIPHHGETQIGDPVPLMVKRVQQWILAGKEVRIFTARIAAPENKEALLHAIESWCILHIGTRLRVTCKKDHNCIELWDDIAVQVIPNTGKRADGKD
jgi:hypothetical protein